MTLTTREELEYIELLEQEEHYQCGRKLWTYFPDTGPVRRNLYQKHMEFFASGADHQERMFIAANRVGKTESAGLYEATLHLTGQYPDWWQGLRFSRATTVRLCGTSSKTVRDILQRKFLGPWGDFGTALLPRETIISTSPGRGIPEAIEIVRVRHVSGGESLAVFKSYDQGRDAFEGTEQDFILEDEEPPLAIHTENLLRTMTTGGHVCLTFTPLQGMSETVLSFLPDGELPQGPQAGTKYVVNAGWDDVPHLSEDAKARMLESIPPFQRDARSKGLPQLGAGLIYPVPEDDYLVDDFAIPKHWLRAYGFDVGWQRTAAVWGAWDRETATLYLYHEYYKGEAEPVIHAEGIKAPGAWIPGVIDPAARRRSEHDGQRLLEKYRGLGLKVTKADNSVETGLYECWEGLSLGRIKVFRSLRHWQKELRLYRRDEKGNVVKENDHLMDAMRYLVMSGRAVAKPIPPKPEEQDEFDGNVRLYAGGSQAWMG